MHRCIGSFASIPRDQLSNICNKLAARTETGYSIDSLRNIYAHLPGVKPVLIDTRVSRFKANITRVSKRILISLRMESDQSGGVGPSVSTVGNVYFAISLTNDTGQVANISYKFFLCLSLCRSKWNRVYARSCLMGSRSSKIGQVSPIYGFIFGDDIRK